MSGILSEYTVMQQNEWANRRFFTAHSHRTGQVVYLVAVPAQDQPALYQHPSLPRLEPVGLEGQTRWLSGPIPEGDTLEDLRNRGTLSESELVSGLLSVLDGMAGLSQLEPPPVPTYLDPACIKRDRLGRWTLDYLALAHAPEARSAGSGVYAFGVLLYWLITGETVRRSRVQVQRIESGAPTGLQYIVVKCLGKSYESLADLRADIAQAGQDHEFRRLVRSQPEPLKRVVDTEHHRIQLGGPQIPMDDRPWALPPRPVEGYRKYIVPPPPNQTAVRAARWGALALVAVVTMAVAVFAFTKVGVIPPNLLPWQSRPSTNLMPDSTPPVSTADNSPAPVVGPVAGPPVPKAEEPAKNVVAQQPAAPKPAPAPQPKPQPKPQPQPQPQQPAPKPTPTPATPAPQPAPNPPAQTTPASPPPAMPAHPEPAAGSEDYKDAVQGALPVLIHYNNTEVGWAWIFPHLANPYISVGTFNRLFGQNILWMPVDGGGVRLLYGNKNLITTDYELVNNRLWLKLTPFLQQALGVKPVAYDDTGMYFAAIQ